MKAHLDQTAPLGFRGVILLHAVWSILLFHSGDAVNITAVFAVHWLTSFVTDSRLFLATVFGVSAIAGVYCAMFHTSRTTRIVCFLPLALMLVSSVGALWAVLSGAYLDGTVIPREHIFGDQIVFGVVAYYYFEALRQTIFNHKPSCESCSNFNQK